MRVISGKYKNRRLFSPNDQSVRPVMDRVKEWVFNVIQDEVAGATVCDLFAGSGAFGIEACSRGARSVSFIDTARPSIKLIEKNIVHIKMDEPYMTFTQNVRNFVKGSRSQFDLIFCDPPYDFPNCQELLKGFAETPFLKDNGLVIFEHHVTTELNEEEKLPFLRDKKFGKTMITIFEKTND